MYYVFWGLEQGLNLCTKKKQTRYVNAKCCTYYKDRA